MSYGQLTLKRGMTTTLDLWNWFDTLQQTRRLRAKGTVRMLTASHRPAIVFQLSGCIPVKLRAPHLNGKDGQIAIEEMQIAYAHLRITKPQMGKTYE